MNLPQYTDDNEMKWLITTLVLSLLNAALMEAFATSKLGRTPVLLPLLLAMLSLVLVCASVVFAVREKKQGQSRWYLHLYSAGIWLGMTALNLKHFNDIMYVA